MMITCYCTDLTVDTDMFLTKLGARRGVDNCDRVVFNSSVQTTVLGHIALYTFCL